MAFYSGIESALMPFCKSVFSNKTNGNPVINHLLMNLKNSLFLDIDECKQLSTNGKRNGPCRCIGGRCGNRCQNTIGGYRCTCGEGYRLTLWNNCVGMPISVALSQFSLNAL